MDPYLQTERLTLSRFGADEADLLVELDSDPAVMRFLTGGAPTTSQAVRSGDMSGVLATYERWGGELGLLAARERAGGAFVGWFLLRPEPEGPRDEVELGYRLRRDAWGQGYATEGATALLHKAFTELGVRTVWGATLSANLASQRVLEKVGMAVTDRLETPPDMQQADGAEHGGLRYAVTREQWEARRA